MKFIKPHHLLFLILALAGLLTFRAYGQSWDEPLFYNYAAAIPAAYQPANWLNVPESVYGSSAEDHKQYGPAYLLLARPVEQTLVFLFRLEEGDAWHLVNFIGFLLALAFFRSLAKRTLPPNLATVATAFFALQPIFWGHAFINPKDIPFMSAFLAAMVFGLNWLDSLAAEKQKSKTETLARLMVAALALASGSACAPPESTVHTLLPDIAVAPGELDFGDGGPPLELQLQHEPLQLELDVAVAALTLAAGQPLPAPTTSHFLIGRSESRLRSITTRRISRVLFELFDALYRALRTGSPPPPRELVEHLATLEGGSLLRLTATLR